MADRPIARQESIAPTSPHLYPATIRAFRVCQHAQWRRLAIHLLASSIERSSDASAASRADGKWHPDPCHNRAVVVTPQERYPTQVPPKPVDHTVHKLHPAVSPIVQSFSPASHQADCLLYTSPSPRD